MSFICQVVDFVLSNAKFLKLLFISLAEFLQLHLFFTVIDSLDQYFLCSMYCELSW